jgi:uncharacterized protein YjhX (UPF0386 family)
MTGQKIKKKKIVEEVVFQPYGKDSLAVNLVATKEGTWIFGPSDVDLPRKLKNKVLVHSYIKIKGKNPKYYRIPMEKNFKVRNGEAGVVARDNKSKSIERLYVLLVYNEGNEFVYLTYAISDENFAFIKSRFNVLASLLFIGNEITITNENTEDGIKVSRTSVESIVKKLRTEF